MSNKETWHLVVTVGTSAIYNEFVGKDLSKGKHDTLRAHTDAYRGSSDQSVGQNLTLFNELVHAHKQFWQGQNARGKRDRLKTSAELVSTEDIVKAIQPEDILLISSDTDEGEFAARVNQDVLKTRHPGMKVDVHRLAGLDQRFKGVYEALGETIDQRYRDEGHRIAFDVTGGFKGTLLFVAAHAFLKPWTIYYRHEDMDKTLVVDLRKASLDVLDTHE